MNDMGWTQHVRAQEEIEFQKTNIATGGEWDYEEMDPGFPGSRDEWGDPGSPANIYSIVYDPDSGTKHSIRLAELESPTYAPISESGNTDFEPVSVGYEDANARLMAQAKFMYQVLTMVEAEGRNRQRPLPDFVLHYVTEVLDKTARPQMAEPESEQQDPPPEDRYIDGIGWVNEIGEAY